MDTWIVVSYPTCVGMNLEVAKRNGNAASLSHICGDESQARIMFGQDWEFIPQMWE